MKKRIFMFCLLIAIMSAAGFFMLNGCQTATSTYSTATATATATASSTAPSPTVSVDISSSAFNSSDITISAETTVVWTNNDAVTHTVTSLSGPSSFDSGNLGIGAVYSLKFSTTGTYTYNCSIHTSMTGRIVVQ